MVSPNLANINSLYAFSKNARLSRTEQSILYNSYSTLLRINSILAINNNTTTWASVTLPYLNYGTNIKSNIINTVLPPLSNATVLLDKQNGIFLEESDELFGISNVNNSVDLVLTYDEFNDGGLVRAEYLSVAGGAGGPGGGGSGGWFTAGSGGGGALQGVIYLPLATVPVVVGGGGAGGTASPCSLAGNGSNSSINNQAVAIGGGRGSGFWNSPVLLPVTDPNSWLIAAQPGGSGGGTHYYTYTSPYGICYVIGEEGKGTPRQGCPGGRWEGNPVGAGGGGAGQAGYSCHGGNGILSGITGTFCYYGGGSGAGGVNGFGGGRAGCGGGAIGRPAGTSGSGFAGNVNTGGAGSGGAAGGGNEPFYPGAAGGSGIVIITYPGPAKYTGGTVSCVGNKVIHCFTTSGNLTYCSRVLMAEYLMVGGGGGGAYQWAGGGGAGSFSTGFVAIDGSYFNTPISVVVGAGGAKGTAGACRGSNGANSSFYGVVSLGGGGGGDDQNDIEFGLAGGSGGGGGLDNVGGPAITSPGSIGYPGGGGSRSPGLSGGGGGGAGQCGNAKGQGFGGDGAVSCISGVATCYAGGGGGAKSYTPQALGGNGGGGCGHISSPTYIYATSGNVNTGGGGGGGSTCTLDSGTGGSGIVIIAYPLPCRASGGTITCASGKVIHTFTSSSNFCITG